MYTVAYALHQFDATHSIESIFNGSMDAQQVLDALDQIIRNDIQFLGATGNVTFDEKGDRRNGLYGYGNILPNGTVHYFGYFDGNIFKINEGNIVWPSYFIDKGLIPRSSKLITRQILTIHPVLFIFISVLVALSSLIVLF
eukprot:720646_1